MGAVDWYFDTSVIVAAAVSRHPHNAQALAVLEDCSPPNIAATSAPTV